MTEAPTTRIHIWDHPESKIAFMETLLKGQTWEAVVHHTGGHEALKPIQKQFHARNFAAELEVDADRNPVMTLRHFGHETGLLEACREMGLVRGARHTFDNLGVRLGKLFGRAKDTLHYLVSDPARALASLYLIGDLVLALAGLGNKDSSAEGKQSIADKLRDIPNLLESFAGVMATIQSLIFIGYAKSGSDLALEELVKAADKALVEGKDLRDIQSWLRDEGMNQAGGLLSGINQFLQRHPIQAGSTAQILGQVSLLASGGLRRAGRMKELEALKATEGADPVRVAELEGEIKSGFQDMVTGVSSILGWGAVMYPEKHHEQKHPWPDPRRAWQEFEAAPNRASTLLLTLATGSGLKAAADKKNWIKMGGYMTYLMGDVLMFFTKSGHYGANAAGQEGVVAEALAAFVGKLQIALGPEAEAGVIRGAALEFARRAALEGKEGQQEALERSPDFQKQVAAQADRIVELTQTQMMGKPRPFDLVAADVAVIVSRFQPEERAEMTQKLAAVIADSQGVAAQPEELAVKVDALLEGIRPVPRTKPVSMQELTADAAKLATRIPAFATPENVSRLFDVLAEKARVLSPDAEKMDRAVTATAAKNLGVPSPVPMPRLGGFALAGA